METALTTAAERPVFVAADDRRARRLRYLAAFAVALAGAWVVALAIGMLGIGRLPGLSLPVIVRGAEQAPPVETPVATKASVAPLARTRTRRAAATPVRSSHAVRAASPTAAVSAPAATTKARKNRHPAKSKTVSPARRSPATLVPDSVLSTTARQGWARRGLTTPPGRTRPPEPKAKAAASPGHTRQQATTDTTTAPAAPVATPVPPGQQKKTDDANQTG